MAGPDFSILFAGQDPQQAITQGLQMGMAMRDRQDARAQQQAALASQQQMKADIETELANPTALGTAKLSMKYPQFSEQFKRSFDMMDATKKQVKVERAGQAYAALHSDKPEIAEKLLRDQAIAYRNGGDEPAAKSNEHLAELIKTDPKAAKMIAGTYLSAAMGPDKFADTFKALGSEDRANALAPAEQAKAAADAQAAGSTATIKATEAKYAEQGILADLEKKKWDITAIKSDIDYKRESNRIAAMNAAANREGNSLKREELKLKIADTVRERDEKLRGKVADVESAAGNIDNMLNTIKRIEKNGSLDSVLGSLEGKAYYPNATLGALNPLGDGDERADAIALIETLGSQAFLAQIPNIKGMGALSNAEGEKLQSAFQNLNRAQSEKQFRASLQEATRLLEKGRSTVSKRYGVPLGNPDTPAAVANDKRPPLSTFQR